MVGKDRWRIGKANEAWIGIKIAKGWPGAKNSPPPITGEVIQAKDLPLMGEIHGTSG